MSTVLYERKKGISYIRLNRPDKYNALNREMLVDLLDVVGQAEKNDDQVVILTGQGKAFSAGGDMAMLQEFSDKAYYDEVMETIGTIIRKLYLMPKIVISAIHGSAAGLGLSLALTADYVVSGQESKMGMMFIGIGLAPDGGGHFGCASAWAHSGQNNLSGARNWFKVRKPKRWGLLMSWLNRM